MKRKVLIILSLIAFIFGVFCSEVFVVLELDKFLNFKYLYLLFFTPFALLILKRFGILHCFILGLLLIAGVTRSLLAIHMPDKGDIDYYAKEHDHSEYVEIVGIVESLPDVRKKNVKLKINVQSVKLDGKESVEEVSGKVLVNVAHYPKIHYGDKIQARGKLETPGVFNGFSYKNYLGKEGIFAFMPSAKVKIISNNNGNFILSLLFKFKDLFEKNLRASIPDPECGFAAGILLGAREGLPNEVIEDFRITGLLHLMALSGSNITILIVAVFWCLKKCPKKIALGVTVTIIVLFVLMVGGDASIVRAGIMGGMGLLILHSGREAHPGYLLLIASGIMIACNPKILLFDVSFQLSVSGVIGMIWFVPLLQSVKIIKKIPEFLGLQEAFLATVAAQIVVSPLAAFHFESYSVVSPLANPIVAPLIPIGMLLSFLSGSFGFVSTPISNVFGFIAYLDLKFGLWIAKVLAQIPYAQVTIQIGVVVFIIWCMAIVGFYHIFSRHMIKQKKQE